MFTEVQLCHGRLTAAPVESVLRWSWSSEKSALGESNIFFPLTIAHVRIRGLEVALRSPRVFGRAQFHLAYSHQAVQGSGGVTGGLTDFSPPSPLYSLDHDQRNTLSTGASVTLPWQSWTSVNLAYGSGFLNGDGPSHLPAHASVDLAFGKDFGEDWSVGLTALNVGNTRYMIDNSNTFGGTHWADPRVVAVQLKYRFHY